MISVFSAVCVGLQIVSIFWLFLMFSVLDHSIKRREVLAVFSGWRNSKSNQRIHFICCRSHTHTHRERTRKVTNADRLSAAELPNAEEAPIFGHRKNKTSESQKHTRNTSVERIRMFETFETFESERNNKKIQCRNGTNSFEFRRRLLSRSLLLLHLDLDNGR